MGEKKKKERTFGFWRRNWLSLFMTGALSFTGLYYWQPLMLIAPFLIVVLAFFFYLFVVKFFYDNRLPCERLFTELREGGWLLIRAVARPGIVIWQKCGAGLDLLTQRLGAEQELVIAEKRRKKLELELLQRRLHAQLAQLPPEPPPLPDTTENGIPEKESILTVKAGIFASMAPGQVPPYARYAPVLMEYLEQVRWEQFTVTQAQQILHKRFGTVKLVLEELVHQRKLEYVTTGKRVAYRPVVNKEDE